MKILIVDDDDVLVAFLAKELEARGCEILQTHFGDGGLSLYKKDGPFTFVLADYRFIPGTRIKDCMQFHTNSTFASLSLASLYMTLRKKQCSLEWPNSGTVLNQP
jgi:CheY-like chemotaxis protein